MRGEVRGLRCLITSDLQRPARGFAFPAFVVETVGGLDAIHFVRGVLTRGAMTLSAGRQAIAAARRAGARWGERKPAGAGVAVLGVGVDQ